MPSSSHNRRIVGVPVVLVAVLVAAVPGAARAQATAPAPPQRIGNIWDSLPHQPTEGSVTAKERETGVAPDVAREHDINKELQNLDEQLLNEEKTHPPTIPPPPPGTN
ncbi:hypothetical protein [Acidibrevibacterium fodinaquatile]|uniref:hypothetical protein n=1 Tax=Acidibrevibacterium fodinaquatile TaxID=1969806 RepID=UPI000E0DC91F|nr:hypothetical protein [Acidibrevibacterium fodinaquatile]